VTSIPITYKFKDRKFNAVLQGIAGGFDEPDDGFGICSLAETSPFLLQALLEGMKRAGYGRIKGDFDSQHAPEPVGPYPHARRVGNLLFPSGIAPRKRGSRAIPGVTLDPAGDVVDYDLKIQCP
jgi:hypothetical protein